MDSEVELLRLVAACPVRAKVHPASRLLPVAGHEHCDSPYSITGLAFPYLPSYKDNLVNTFTLEGAQTDQKGSWAQQGLCVVFETDAEISECTLPARLLTRLQSNLKPASVTSV